ncbi:S-layer homology domain-containing protein [Planococcus liqunii]|uniref:S-layer homology domain-containing protein n=1 Tax=Planococcus liqunii TaxID=3058394 RepID=A0ABT8MNN3_9BACL|nr:MULTISPECIES: S-layer homology domain-containing protein [unclassified Planococcus (in: firmicutes)]MDN7226478.1 S-layer homology domain-containing protein [Planococcus sp. N064]WKA50258.1 S-layer homology domain-containing protein [Planococcus sp. N056]
MRSISRIVASILLLAGVLGFASTTQASDIVPGSALEKEMQAMIDQGILHGYGNGVYKPKDKVTREQFAAFINRALKLPAGIHNFKDVPMNSQLSADIGAVYTAGLMAGLDDSTFKPTTLITREQMAQTLNNVLEYSNMELKEKRVSFSDERDFVSSGGIKAVYHILHYGITAGIPDGKGGLKFAPKDSTTREQAAAFIYRFLEAKKAVPAPEPPASENPAPVPNDDNLYYLGYVEKGIFVKQEYGHKDYASAAASFKAVPSAKAILRGDEILHIRSGIAYGDRVLNGQKQVTTIYYDPAFKKQATYIEHGREIGYIDSTAEYVKVQVGGTVGYAKQSEVDFLPDELMTHQDYYMVNQWGTLNHYQYNYVTKTRGSFSIGPAPTGMKANVTYFSRDGIHFESGSTVLTHYPYFQYQSVRTKTSYTAEELDRFIMERLTALNNSSSTYKDAVKRSKLIGTGRYFIAMQEKYNINALFMLSAAMHESENGMSGNAQTKNNLFGIRVFDGSPHEGTVYAKAENSIDAFAREYMNRNYVNPNGTYANGASPGNKTTGLNVSYASDPTWGSKVAGHMFRIDLALGKKDINKYKLGITNTALTKVRKTPQGELLYTYKREYLGVENAFGYPVVILDTAKHTDGYIWYKIISDLNPEHDTNNGVGWVRSDLVDLIN